MEEWHEVWKPKEKLLDKSLKYILPIGVILFFIGKELRVINSKN
jgi:hypothetical protein